MTLPVDPQSPVYLKENLKYYSVNLLPIAVSKVLSEYELDHLMYNGDISVHEDRLARGLVFTLRTYLLGNKHTDTWTDRKKYVKKVTMEVKMETPSTWWQMLKQEHFPEWYKKRWPVLTTPQYFSEMKEVEFDVEKSTTHSVTKICPHANEVWPHKDHLDFLVHEPDFFKRNRNVLHPRVKDEEQV